MDYWARKEELRAKAHAHRDEMRRRFSGEIDKCVTGSKIYSTEAPPLEKGRALRHETKIELVEMDSVSAVRRYTQEDEGNRVCVLNFASYKSPGGMFLNGSSAQEESLCHESILYNVLSQLMYYYDHNASWTNRCLYTNRAVYTPDVVFCGSGKEACKADVLTCAAPNKLAAVKYHNVSDDANNRALIERIGFVLGVAANQKVDTLILGAFGCGVFGQNPKHVAAIFAWYLQYEFRGVFKHVVFAIPDAAGKNYRAFKREIADLQDTLTIERWQNEVNFGNE